MNLIADGYLFEKHHSQRIVEIEEKQRVLAMVNHQQKNTVVLKKVRTFFHQLIQLRKIRIQVSFDMQPFSHDGQLA